MLNKIEGLSLEEIASRILSLRSSGQLSEAIVLCKEASKKFPNSYFYPKVTGDLYFQLGNYEAASKSFIEFLKKIPPGQHLFGDFARRYYRLRRVWPKEKISEYAVLIRSEIEEGHLSEQTAFRSKVLIKSDLPKEIEISPEGQKFIELLSDDTNFDDLVNQVKKLEISNSIELEALLDQYILNRTRMSKTFRIDTYCISIYEKMEKYDSALKVAEELLSVHLESVIVRSFFRICRKINNYGRADNLLAKYPEILKSGAFNVLYELVYYFEAQDNFEQARITLGKIETHTQSLPIQRTVRNFYLRYGLLDDAKRVENTISKLYISRKESGKFSREVQESEISLGSKIKELYSELEHQKQLAAISDLTTGISHELGQPITNIRYTVQFYSRLFEKKSEIQKEDVINIFASILEETERMGGLIKRLSPLTSSKNVIETFDLIDRIQRRVKAENTYLHKLKITANVSPITPIYLVGDPVKCDQLISNLLLNSIDAIKEKKKPGRINIDVKDYRDKVEIVFTDTGVGIPAKYRGKIFDPFFSTKTPGKGEGLGLFIVWNLLKMQGGKISLDPNYKNGARFLISVPKTTYHEEEVG